MEIFWLISTLFSIITGVLITLYWFSAAKNKIDKIKEYSPDIIDDFKKNWVGVKLREDIDYYLNIVLTDAERINYKNVNKYWLRYENGEFYKQLYLNRDNKDFFNKLFVFRCDNGHLYETTINNLIDNEFGCSVCDE